MVVGVGVATIVVVVFPLFLLIRHLSLAHRIRRDGHLTATTCIISVTVLQTRLTVVVVAVVIIIIIERLDLSRILGVF